MYNQAVSYAPGNVPLLCKRSYAFMLSTPPNFDSAMDDAGAAIQLDPTYWRGWMQQGQVRLRNGDVQGAADAFGVAADFASGEDKVICQTSLVDAQIRLGQAPQLGPPTPAVSFNDYQRPKDPEKLSSDQKIQSRQSPSIQPQDSRRDSQIQQHMQPSHAPAVQEAQFAQAHTPPQTQPPFPKAASPVASDGHIQISPPVQVQTRFQTPPASHPGQTQQAPQATHTQPHAPLDLHETSPAALPQQGITSNTSSRTSSPPILQQPIPDLTRNPEQPITITPAKPAYPFPTQPIPPATRPNGQIQTQQQSLGHTVNTVPTAEQQHQSPTSLQLSPKSEPQEQQTNTRRKSYQPSPPTQPSPEPSEEYKPPPGPPPSHLQNQRRLSEQIPPLLRIQELQGRHFSLPTQQHHQPNLIHEELYQSPSELATSPSSGLKRSSHQFRRRSDTRRSISPTSSKLPPPQQAKYTAEPSPAAIQAPSTHHAAVKAAVSTETQQKQHTSTTPTDSPLQPLRQSPQLNGSPLISVPPSGPSASSTPSNSSPASNGRNLPALTTVTQPVPSKQVLSDSLKLPIQPQQRAITVHRNHDASSVSWTAVSSVPFGLEEAIEVAFDIPQFPPSDPSSVNSTDPTALSDSQKALKEHLGRLESVLAVKNKGSLSIRPYTASSNIDAVRLFYVGLTQAQLTPREIRPPVFLHPTFHASTVDSVSYPGSTFLDMDCESSAYYEGRLPGTIGISGYSEEYREHQSLLSPIANLTLEWHTKLPRIGLDRIVERIRALLSAPNDEDDESLKEMLGITQLAGLQASPHTNEETRQAAIESICLALNKNVFLYTDRFVDFSKARNISNHTLGGLNQGIGLHNFLFQILLGAELLIRLRKEPVATSYAGLVTDSISALIVLADLWMQNVTINGPMSIPPIPPGKPVPIPYTLYSKVHQRQVEGLIQFAEALQWPLVEETKRYIKNAYNDLTSGKAIGYDICDWLFGLILPGKIFRHRIMCCLVYSSPSLRAINPALFFDDGIVVNKKSYWPKRTVLGRVLGAYEDANSVCGWIGPVPAPTGRFRGWIRIQARRIPCPTPCSTNTEPLKSFGFGHVAPHETTESVITNITNADEWIQVSPPSRPGKSTSRSVLREVRLSEVPPASSQSPSKASATKEYLASLVFGINGNETKYTLYSNPLFVSPHPCVGVHTLHRRQAQQCLASITRATDLKKCNSTSDQFLLIDATGEGEELIARAWCSEKARHAVVRKGQETCFACAITMASSPSGLGFNVLIWAD